MTVQIVQPVFAPEPFILVRDKEWRAEDALRDRLFQVARIGVGPFQQPAVCERGIKPCLFQTRTDHVVFCDVFVVRPAGFGQRLHQRADISTSVLRGNDRVG